MIAPTVIALLALVSHVTHGKSCSEAYSCFSQPLITTNTSNNIECWGFKSCAQSTLIHSQTEASIECHGSYSCYNSQAIRANNLGVSPNISAIVIRCYGLYSCAFVDSMYNSNGGVVCYGEFSCADSKIYLGEGENLLHCAGSRSCLNAIIVSSYYNIVNGYLGAQNAIFKSNDSYVLYYFYGVSSGDNATVICGIGHYCYIRCASNACNNLNFMCADNINSTRGSGSCTFGFDCQSSEKNDACPNGYILPLGKSLPPLINVTKPSSKDFNNSINICDENITNSIVCDDYRECAYNAKSLINKNNPVCCRAGQACLGANNITSDILGVGSGHSDNKYNNSVAVRCDGYQSCEDITNFIVAVNGGDMHFTAYWAAAGWGRGIIKTMPGYDIYCTTPYACRWREIKNGNNLYCTSKWSCDGSLFIGYFNNIYFYGALTALESTVGDVSNNVYCATWWACQLANFSNIGNSLFGYGISSLESAVIVNVTNVKSKIGN